MFVSGSSRGCRIEGTDRIYLMLLWRNCQNIACAQTFHLEKQKIILMSLKQRINTSSDVRQIKLLAFVSVYLLYTHDRSNPIEMKNLTTEYRHVATKSLFMSVYVWLDYMSSQHLSFRKITENSPYNDNICNLRFCR